MSILKTFITRRVTLSEVADPKPSLAAGILLNAALKQAYLEQQAVRKKAAILRAAN